MTQTIKGRKVAFLTADEGVEQAELTEPWKAIEGRHEAQAASA